MRQGLRRGLRMWGGKRAYEGVPPPSPRHSRPSQPRAAPHACSAWQRRDYGKAQRRAVDLQILGTSKTDGSCVVALKEDVL